MISGRLPNGRNVRLDVAEGRIVAVEEIAGKAGSDEPLLSAGFVDLQLNGYGGIDFNDPATSPEEIIEAVRLVRRTGVTAFCATIITGGRVETERCIANLLAAVRISDEAARAIVGLHIEGPYISPEDGPRGAHPREHVRPPDWDEFHHWQDLAGGMIRIVTLSPEWPEANGFIAKAATSGVIVAIGHTAATPAQIAGAVAAGATMSTHLGNGSHAKIDRHPNYIWEQLAEDRLQASFIVDGHHLPPSVVKCFIRGKTPERSILVTDAIAAAGLPAGRYRLGPVEVEVTPQRRVNLPGTPYLAGSVLEMNDAIAMTVAYAGVSLDEAIQMATVNPARILGLDAEIGRIAVGARADLLTLDWNPEAIKLNCQELSVY